MAAVGDRESSAEAGQARTIPTQIPGVFLLEWEAAGEAEGAASLEAVERAGRVGMVPAQGILRGRRVAREAVAAVQARAADTSLCSRKLLQIRLPFRPMAGQAERVETGLEVRRLPYSREVVEEAGAVVAVDSPSPSARADGLEPYR